MKLPRVLKKLIIACLLLRCRVAEDVTPDFPAQATEPLAPRVPESAPAMLVQLAGYYDYHCWGAESLPRLKL